MILMKTIVTASALVALAATPLAAQSLSGSAEVDGAASVDTGAADVGAGASIGAETDAETTMEADTAGTTTSSETQTSTRSAVDAMIEAGNARVVSSNDTVIGTITDVAPDAEGKTRYTIDVDDSMGLAADRITLVSGSEMTADGMLSINMTEEEFAAAADQSANATSATSANME